MAHKQKNTYDLKKRDDLLPTVSMLNSALEGQIRSTSVLLMKYVSEFQVVLTPKQLSELEKIKARLDDLYLNMAEFEKNTALENFIITEELIRKIDEFGDEIFGFQKIVVKNNRVQDRPTTITTKMGFILLREHLSTLSNTLRIGFKPQIKIQVVSDEKTGSTADNVDVLPVLEDRKESSKKVISVHSKKQKDKK